MKSEIAQEWAEALRSGEYIQGQGQLEKDGKHCALGVLCAIASTKGIITYDNRSCDRVEDKEGRVTYDGRSGMLPPMVVYWAGMTNCRGSYGNRDILQDNEEGKSFDQIANVIAPIS